MSFFNKREEVINIQLTRFGRESLMKGKFSPVFYRFFDDGVVYDSSWAGFEEEQNASEDRIKEAPVSKPQSAYVGVETALKREYDTKNIEDDSISRYYEPLNEDQDEEERIYSLRNPLYSSKIGTDKTPSFRVVAMTEPFSGSLTYSSASGENIPQAKVKFESLTMIDQVDNLEDAIEEATVSDTMIFQNGVMTHTYQSPLVFSAAEQGVPDTADGFEIEVYEEIDGSLVQMYLEHEDPSRVWTEYFEILSDDEAITPSLDLGLTSNTSTSIFRKSRVVVRTPDLTKRDPTLAAGAYSELPSDDDVEKCD